MLKYPCLVLDHDDTVVQSMKTLSYPFFLYILEQFRPGESISVEDYILDCHNLGFMDLCKVRYGFTDKELAKSFGTSRIDVFRALERLKKCGLINSRKRAGTVVTTEKSA